MEDNIHYALFDYQLDRIVPYGLNERSLKKIQNDLINFLLLGNFSTEGEKSIKNNSLEELLNYYEFELLKANVKFNYPYEYYDIEKYKI